MTAIYILQNREGYAIGATHSEPEAQRICKEHKTTAQTYREVPFYSGNDTIVITAGPIPDEYLPKHQKFCACGNPGCNVKPI